MRQGTLRLHGKTANDSGEPGGGRTIVWGLSQHAVTLGALQG